MITSCLFVDRIRVSAAFRGNRIYVAREFKEGTCPFEQIITHEERHATLDYQLLQQWKSELHRDLNGFLSQIPPQRTNDRDALFKIWLSKLQEHVDGALDSFSKRLALEQAKIDTQSEYTRLSKACGGAVADILAEVHARRFK